MKQNICSALKSWLIVCLSTVLN